MTRLLISLLLLCAASTASGKDRDDFLALLMECVAEQNGTDYHCFTVSPKGMDELNAMLSAEGEGKALTRETLEHIHSLRFFESESAGARYAHLADSLLSSRAKLYRPFVGHVAPGGTQDKVSGKAKAEASKASCVWLRKNGRRVVEMIVMQRPTESGALQIVNVTGDLSRDFIDKLLKL